MSLILLSQLEKTSQILVNIRQSITHTHTHTRARFGTHGDKENNAKEILKIKYYINNVAYVKNGNLLLESVEGRKGLRQGCSLSPILLNIYMGGGRNFGSLEEQLPIKENKRLFSINYADDQVEIAQDSDDL